VCCCRGGQYHADDLLELCFGGCGFGKDRAVLLLSCDDSHAEHWRWRSMKRNFAHDIWLPAGVCHAAYRFVDSLSLVSAGVTSEGIRPALGISSWTKNYRTLN